MQIELAGTEAHTIECTGILPAATAQRLLPAALEPRRCGDGVEVGLLCFAMAGLGLVRPLRLGPRFDYGEALWRIGVTWRGEPAWFAVACDLDRAAIRALGSRLVRYPVRRASVQIDAERAVVERDGQRLALTVRSLGASPAPVPARVLLVADGGTLYRIPWREDPAPSRHEASLAVEGDALVHATLGAAVQWTPQGLVHAGRIHRCGFASPA